MLRTAAVLLGIGALGGLLMAAMRLRGMARPPSSIAMLHGALASAGLALAGYAAFVVGIPVMARASRRRVASCSTCRPARSTTTGPRTSSPARTARGFTSPSARTATSARRAWRPKTGRAAIWEVDPHSGATRISPRACAIPTAWPGSRTAGPLDQRERTRRDRQRSRAGFHDLGAGWRILRLALQLLRPARRCPRAAAASGPGGERDSARLRAGGTHGLARTGLVGGHHVARRLRRGHVRRAARLVEPQPPAATRCCSCPSRGRPPARRAWC